MERLTIPKYYSEHAKFRDGTGCINPFEAAVDRLAEYEDTGLTPQNIICREDDIKLLQIQNKEFREGIHRLRQERDHWECEAKKWCSKLGEIRIAMSKER